ncbi:spore cortex biosynthesis protein YabQ [Clostridiaceae bacterium 35-E11]
MSFVSDQMYVFSATLYGGIVIGFIYDLYRIFRRLFKPKKIAAIIQDLIFWIVISIAAVMVLLFSNDGQLRFYTFLGFITGALLYNKILSHIVMRTMITTFCGIRKVLCRILQWIGYPIRIFLHLMRRPYLWLKNKLRPVYYRLKRLSLLPKRYYNEMKKYIKIMKIKK